MILNVTIEKRIAKYVPSGEKIVCGNSGNKVKFAFDEEWADHTTKTARFIWNKKYFDVEFTGDECEIPVIDKVTAFSIGVYAGETAEGAPIISSTAAVVPTELSIRCMVVGANNGTGENYTNEARGYALQAQEAAETATDAVANIKGGLEYIGRIEMPSNAFDTLDNVRYMAYIEHDVYSLMSTAKVAVLRNVYSAGFQTLTFAHYDYLMGGTISDDLCVYSQYDGPDDVYYYMEFSKEVFEGPVISNAISGGDFDPFYIDLYR